MHFLKIRADAGGKIIEAGDVLAGFQQLLEKMGADESRATGDEPAPGFPAERVEYA